MMERIITKQLDMLEYIKKIPWMPGKLTDNHNSNIKTPQLLIGHDWYLEKYDLISRATPGSVIIDVGCKSGDWSKFIKNIINDQVINFGIDPIHSINMAALVKHYYNVAIDNIDHQSEATFHLFDEEGCNSLLPPSESFNMRSTKGTINVPVRSLESILLEQVNSKTSIHYLKCDCQGKDVEVVKSLRSFLTQTKYIQIETSFSHKDPFYAGQPSYEDDIIEMDKLGFRPIIYMEYIHSPLPEGEIIFQNKTL